MSVNLDRAKMMLDRVADDRVGPGRDYRNESIAALINAVADLEAATLVSIKPGLTVTAEKPEPTTPNQPPLPENSPLFRRNPDSGRPQYRLTQNGTWMELPRTAGSVQWFDCWSRASSEHARAEYPGTALACSRYAMGEPWV